MRASATILALLLTSAVAAQEETTRADYSKDSMMRVLRAQTEEEKDDPLVRFHVGQVEFNAIGTRWHFNYLPIMAPISGTRLGITNEWPDPFALTGTTIATPRRAWNTRRQVNLELRRINESEKKKVKIKINAN
ncbi:MAG TPA: hypothetical protein VHW00_18700 [Thermoanaerobaculia bacterium]|nr:hypothetical protein [Thermoanaerobaculia bacterium]